MDNVELEPNEIPQNLVYALAASTGFTTHPGGACFAATSSGLLKSSDGQVWSDAFASLELTGPSMVTALAVSPEYERDGCVLAGVSGGVLRSSDWGSHWTSALFPPPAPMVSSLAISPDFGRDGTIFAGTLEDGVLISTDGGSRWAAWNFGLLDLNILSLAISPDFARDETLLAGCETGLFRSANGGRAWREVNLPAGDLAVTALAFSPAFASDRTLYAGTDGAGLWRSQDAGKTWAQLTQDAGIELVNQVLLAPRVQTSPVIWLLSEEALLVSRDDGESWQEHPTESGEGSILCAVSLLPDSGLLAGFSGPKFARI